MFPKGPKANGSDKMAEIMSFVSTGNADPILHEIAHALAALLETGEETTIDLGAIPFAGGDERRLDEVLGTGEVRAVLQVMGESHVQETAIAGVWRVDHFDEAGETRSRFIEITFMPGILMTQRDDALTGLQVLNQRLAAATGASNN